MLKFSGFFCKDVSHHDSDSLFYSKVTFLSFLILWLQLTGCSSSVELDWHEEETYRWAEVSPGFFGRTGFSELPSSKSGIDFVNRVTEEEIVQNRHYMNGSGVAAGDVNGNGLIDLYFTGMGSPNRLYRNLGGMEFEDITDEAGVAHDGHYSTGAVFADVNGNGHPDLLVASLYDGVALYINDGEGKFEQDMESGFGSTKLQGSHTLALADINGNGYLDVYVTNYKVKLIEDELPSSELTWEKTVEQTYDENGEAVYTLLPEFQDYFVIVYRDGIHPETRKIGEKDQLFLNNGMGVLMKSNTRNRFFWIIKATNSAWNVIGGWLQNFRISMAMDCPTCML